MMASGDEVEVKRVGDRTFGLVMATVLAAVAGVVWWISGAWPVWVVGVAGLLAASALLAPGMLLPLNRSWGVLGRKLGVVSNTVLLGAFFYLVLMPFGLVARIFGRAAFRKAADPSVETYWVPIERGASPENYRDMF